MYCYLVVILFTAGLSCATAGVWSEWSEYGPCKTNQIHGESGVNQAQDGVQHRKRVCQSSPPPKEWSCVEGKREVEKRICQIPKDFPMWSVWSNYGNCSAPCGPGVQKRLRECRLGVRPEPGSRHASRKPCTVGEKQQKRRNCTLEDCKVPVWSDWSDFSECSAPCGPGVRTKERTCHIANSTGSELKVPQEVCNAVGEKERVEENCTIKRCAVDGGWSDWNAFGPCGSPDCSPLKMRDIHSYQYEIRTCSNPFPDNGMKMCQGTFARSALCFRPKNCKVHGGWSAWTRWTDWDCLEENRKRIRVCNNPSPRNSGDHCKGHSIGIITKDESLDLFLEACPEEPVSTDGAEDSTVVFDENYYLE